MDRDMMHEEEEEEQFGGLEAQFIDNAVLYKVCSMAGDLLESASIVVSETGLSIQTTNPSSVAVLMVDLPARLFDSYRCEGEKVAHVNMETLVSALRKTGNDAAKFVLTLKILAEDRESLIIQILDKKTKNVTKHKIKLWKEEKHIIFFKDAIFDNYRVVSSTSMYDEINDLSRIVDSRSVITLEAGNDFKLCTVEIYGQSEIVMKQGVSLGYKLYQKQVDGASRDENGNYDVLYNLDGLDQRKGSVAKSGSTASKTKKRKRGTSVKQEEKEKAISVDTDDGTVKINTDQLDSIVEQKEYDANRDAQLIEAAEPKVPTVSVPLSLALLKVTAKGLRLSDQTFILIKPQYPVWFLQSVQQYGRVLVAVAPHDIDEQQSPSLDNEEAMQSLLKVQNEQDG